MTNKEKWHEEKLAEARNAAIIQQRADIDYIAMMTDVELPEDGGTQEEALNDAQ